MAATDAQKQIRDNALELQEFLQDLKSWGHSMKHKDQQVKSQAIGDKNFPPVRGQSTNASGSPGQSQQRELPSKVVRGGKVDPSKANTDTVQQNQAPTAANHTYDFFRDKWDKFDVETALREIDEEDRTGHKDPAKKKSVSSTSRLASTHISESGRRINQSQIVRDTSTFRDERLSDTLGLRESGPDAMSEKDAGNQFYKEKKYAKAIESYSRSIALQPSAVAYGNRAMAFLKIRRFEDAETDCTEAISLDDRYTKAYARRGTARQELKQYLAAIGDFEFALRLEPENKELQKQYKEAKEMYEKENGITASVERVKIPLSKVGHTVASRPVPEDPKSQQVKLMRPIKSSPALPHREEKVSAQVSAPVRRAEEVIASTRAAAARAAASATAGVARSLVAPRTSYEFEAMWKSLSGDRTSQGRLLKMLDPSLLPSLFKDSLGAPLMMDMIEALELFFPDDASFAVEVLEHLPEVGRFSMLIMSLTSKQKNVLSRLWCGAFRRVGKSDELSQRLDCLLSAYRLQL